MELTDLVDIANKVVTSVALIVGGTWAYFKFARGRTFAYRAELGISLEYHDSRHTKNLGVIISLTNAGLSKIPLNEKMKAVRIFGVREQGAVRVGSASWERVVTTRCFDKHDWLEAQETIIDEHLYVLPNDAPPGGPAFVAYQVEAVVGAKRRANRQGIRWHARKILVPPSKATEEPTASPSNLSPSSEEEE